MIKNVRLKKILVDYLFPIFSLINRIVRKDDKTIFFYCANDELNDNSEALFNYLVEHEFNKKYHIFCSVGYPEKYLKKQIYNVCFISKLRGIYQYMKSGHVFYCMGKMPIKPTKNQIVINLWHGVPLKKIGLMTNVSNGKEFFFTYVCSPSKTWVPIMAKAFGCPEENVCICGEPKADKLFRKKEDNKEKLIVWTPTFKKSDYLGYSDSDQTDLLPLFHQNEWEKLNAYLKEKKIRIVVKLHPMQNLYGLSSYKLSNLEIFSSPEFNKEKGDIFDLLSQSDALISDYSGIFLDYLVLNRPISFILDDYDSYKNTRGFVFDDPLKYMPGKKIFSKIDFFNFIDDFSKGLDEFAADRKKVNLLVNQYSDGHNCMRILKFSKII